MLKLTYNHGRLGGYKHCFVIGNAESIFDLWFKLTNAKYEHNTPSYKPCDIKVTNLDGVEIDMHKGIAEAYAFASKTLREN